MTQFQITILLSFAIVFYVISVDKNVADYLTLVFKMMKLNLERFYWMVQYHPNNFITTWRRNRQYDRIAKELQNELAINSEE